jgi:hypothetical protein
VIVIVIVNVNQHMPSEVLLLIPTERGSYRDHGGPESELTCQDEKEDFDAEQESRL